MIVILSGEGPTDLGVANGVIDNARGGDFIPGPLAWIIDRLIDTRLQSLKRGELSTIQLELMIYVSKKQLVEALKDD